MSSVKFIYFNTLTNQKEDSNKEVDVDNIHSCQDLTNAFFQCFTHSIPQNNIHKLDFLYIDEFKDLIRISSYQEFKDLVNLNS